MSTLSEQLQASLDMLSTPDMFSPNGLPPARRIALVAASPAPRESGGLPAELYYTGTEFAVPARAMQPIDETRPLRPSDREARALVAQSRAGMIRFFAGRWSHRLGKVVRPA